MMQARQRAEREALPHEHEAVFAELDRKRINVTSRLIYLTDSLEQLVDQEVEADGAPVVLPEEASAVIHLKGAIKVAGK